MFLTLRILIDVADEKVKRRHGYDVNGESQTQNNYYFINITYKIRRLNKTTHCMLFAAQKHILFTAEDSANFS